uniref:VPS37D subunit of ESCRT-I n=1 Tax=Sphenodon punctatus TaxID=8508 RepID=A0A8D0G6I3_SPHPU
MNRGRSARGAAEPGSSSAPGFGVLSSAQLRSLLQDETKLQRVVRLSRKFQSLQLERETCLASNYTLAKQNLSLQPQLENGKASLAIKYQELQELQEACREKQQCLGKCPIPWSPQSALHQLRAELDGVEAEAEEQMERFLCWELPLDAFLELFQHSRALSHLRRTQLEKLQELLQKEKQPEPPAPCCEEQHTSPSKAVIPFPVPSAPPGHHLPPLGSPLHLIGHIPLLSPLPFRLQKPPHR